MSPRVTVPLSQWGGGWTGLLFSSLPSAKCGVGGQKQVRGVARFLVLANQWHLWPPWAWERSEQIRQVSRISGLASHQHETVKPPDHKGRNLAKELSVWMASKPSYFLNFSQVSKSQR